MKLVSAILFMLASAALPQSLHDLFGTAKFHRAFTEGNAGEIAFDPFQELNWEAGARASLAWLNLDQPTPAQIARLSTFESAGPQFRSVDFRAPLNAAVSQTAYLLIHAEGVVPLQPVQLKGIVDFHFDASMTSVERKVFSGAIVGKPSRPVTTAAFVVAGRPADVRDIHPGARFEKRKQTGSAVYDFAEGGRVISWTSSPKEEPDVMSALAFRLFGQQLLLVRWVPDFCASSYTLFSVGASLEPIAGNDYDCDP